MKRPVIDDELEEMIQDYANRNCNGNFTEAVSILTRSALFFDSIDLAAKVNKGKE